MKRTRTMAAAAAVLCGALAVCLPTSSAVGSTASPHSGSCYDIPANGTDDTATIRSAVQAHSCVNFTADTTYKIDGSRIHVPAGEMVHGDPGNSVQLLSYGPDDTQCTTAPPAGDFPQDHLHCSAFFLSNRMSPDPADPDVRTDASDVVVDGVNIDGRRDDLALGTKFSGGTAIEFSRSGTSLSDNVTIENSRIDNWPGVSMYSSQFSNLVVQNVVSTNPGRGGIVITGAVPSTNVQFLNVTSTGSGDDALALLGVVGFKVEDSTGTTRSTDPVEDGLSKITLHGAGLALRNVRGVAPDEETVSNFTTGYSKNAGVLISSYPTGTTVPGNIIVEDSTIAGSVRSGILVNVGSTSNNFTIQNNNQIQGAASYPAVDFENSDASGVHDVSPTTFSGNANLSTPVLKCTRITGVSGTDGSC